MLLRGGHETRDPRLGRVPEFDSRSRNFRAVDRVGDTPTVRRRTWRLDVRLDQLSFPRCVGFAWTHDDAAAPTRRRVTAELAIRWYETAQRNDEWAGEDYGGSSTLGGAKAGVELAKFSEYLWCFGMEDLVATVANAGPVVVGTNWYRSMFRPNAEGLVTIDGPIDGGHEWLVRGINLVRATAIGTNSWNRSWGRNGDFEISLEDLDRLLREDGDACYPVR